jgi:hypothetical protein
MIFKRTRFAHVSCEFFNKFAGLRQRLLRVMLIELCVCSAPRPLPASLASCAGSPKRPHAMMRVRRCQSTNRRRPPYRQYEASARQTTRRVSRMSGDAMKAAA